MNLATCPAAGEAAQECREDGRTDVHQKNNYVLLCNIGTTYPVRSSGANGAIKSSMKKEQRYNNWYKFQ